MLSLALVIFCWVVTRVPPSVVETRGSTLTTRVLSRVSDHVVSLTINLPMRTQILFLKSGNTPQLEA
jgi:hypothetical protein